MNSAAHKPPKFVIGNKFASALAGFVAGAIVVLIVLWPWLYILGKLCPVEGQYTSSTETENLAKQ